MSEWDADETDDWEKGAMHIWKEPIDGRDYIMGVDVAEGMGEDGDGSTFQVLDTHSREQVAEFTSNTVPPYVFAQIIALVGNYYNTALVAVENGGPGLAVIEKLKQSLYYENLFYHQIRSSEKAGVTVTRTTRPLILESLQNYMQNNTVKIHSNRLIRELLTFMNRP